jgi:hypothetical protein
MTAAKWLQFLEHVRMRWPNLPVRHANVPEDLRRILQEFGVSPRRVERELQEVTEEFERKVRCATEIERSVAA